MCGSGCAFFAHTSSSSCVTYAFVLSGQQTIFWVSIWTENGPLISLAFYWSHYWNVNFILLQTHRHFASPTFKLSQYSCSAPKPFISLLTSITFSPPLLSKQHSRLAPTNNTTDFKLSSFFLLSLLVLHSFCILCACVTTYIYALFSWFHMYTHFVVCIAQCAHPYGWDAVL